MSDDLIWVCFEPINYPVPRILHGRSDPNGDKDVYVPYVPADRIEQLERERDDYAHKLMKSNTTYTEMHIAIEQLQDKLAKAVEALRKLDKAASDVSKLGAVTGSQWSRLAVASLNARTVLAELEGNNE